jgi:tetratricopeptide (TPR) repeat protein
MPDNAHPLPPTSPEHRRAAAGQFERANQVIATGNHDYGIKLLLSCCKLDPSNLTYRLHLRRTEKTKYKNNLRGSMLAWLTTAGSRAQLKAAKTKGDYLKVLEYAEEVLVKNPWDVGAQLDMAAAASELGLLDLAIWTLEQARQKDPKDLSVNRALARQYEKRGNFAQAIALWEMIRKVAPTDKEAQGKAKDLAASETIARGQYQQAVGGQGSARVAGTGTGNTSAEMAAARSSDVHRAVGAPPANEPPKELPATDRVSAEAAKIRARIDADPTIPNAHLQLARLYRKVGQLDQARAVLEKALGPTANDFEVGLELADLQLEPLRQDLALAEEQQRKAPGDQGVRKVRHQLMKEINTRELEVFRQKADRYPTEMIHRLELGVRLLRAGQTEEAIRELQAARGDPRHQWRALLYLGHCFKNRQNWRLAKRNFEEALQNLPAGEEATKKDLLFQLARGSAEAGELAEAIDLGHELANLDFGFRGIGKLIDEWQDRLQKAGAPKR